MRGRRRDLTPHLPSRAAPISPIRRVRQALAAVLSCATAGKNPVWLLLIGANAGLKQVRQSPVFGIFTSVSAYRTKIIGQTETTLHDVLGTVDVDREAYASCSKTYIPTPELVTLWFHANPNIYTILKDVDSSKVVGYINAMPIGDDFAAGVRSGTFDESSIDDAALVRYGATCSYHLYICSVAILQPYRSGAALLALLREFAWRMNARLRAGDQLQDIYVDAVTDAGGVSDHVNP